MNKKKIRILVCGSQGSGKTSFIQRCCYLWQPECKYGFGLKTVVIDNLEIEITLIAYQLRCFSPKLVEGVQGALFLFDSSFPSNNNRSLDFAISCKKSFDRFARIGNYLVPCLLIASKSDLCQNVDFLNLEYLQKTNGFSDFICTSAKDLTNLDKSLRMLLSHILPLMD